MDEFAVIFEFAVVAISFFFAFRFFYAIASAGREVPRLAMLALGMPILDGSALFLRLSLLFRSAVLRIPRKSRARVPSFGPDRSPYYKTNASRQQKCRGNGNVVA